MSKPIHVLLLEDNPDQAALVIDYLTLEGGYQVDHACDIAMVWELISRADYDIALFDFRLPDGTGLEALEELRQRAIELPVIMVTGQGDERIAAQTIQSGAYDYVVKAGLYFQTIPAIIQKVLRQYKLQKSVEESLEKIRYQALLLSNVRDAVIVWDERGKITFWNTAAENLFLRNRADQTGKLVQETYFPLIEPLVLFEQLDQIDGKEIERQIIRESSLPIWISSRITSLRDETRSGHLIGWMDVIRDISERKQAEEQIKAAQSRLVQSARMSAIGELASGIAHRIYNPLTTILAETQLLQQQFPAGHTALESLADMQKAGWKAKEVVQQLLDYSSPTVASKEKIAINTTIQNALILVGAQIEAAGINLQSSLSPEIPNIYANSRQLQDLWVNLLLLARDACNDSKKHSIRIWTTLSTRKNVVVEIRDDGNPIPPEHSANIFEPDFVSSKIGRGTGLELSICREIVRQNKGQILVQSTLNYTAFQIHFPIE